MSVQYYIFGKLVGGSTPGGDVIVPAEASYGPPETFRNTMAAVSETVTLSASSKEITVRNVSDAAILEYSFDGGLTYLLLGPYGEKTYDIQVTNIILRDTAGANPTYEIVAALGSA